MPKEEIKPSKDPKHSKYYKADRMLYTDWLILFEKNKIKPRLEEIKDLEKIMEKQILNIEYLRNLDENLKKHSKEIKNIPNIKIKQNTSIEKYILSKNIYDSNNNNSSKISSLANNLSDYPLKKFIKENIKKVKNINTPSFERILILEIQ